MFRFFQHGGHPPYWIFAKSVWRCLSLCIAQFGWSRCSNFDVVIFNESGLKMRLHVPSGFFGGFDPRNGEQPHRDQKGRLFVQKHVTRRIGR